MLDTKFLQNKSNVIENLIESITGHIVEISNSNVSRINLESESLLSNKRKPSTSKKNLVMAKKALENIKVIEQKILAPTNISTIP